MRKFIFPSPLATLTIILLICTVSFFIVNACRKMDRSEVTANNEIDIRTKFFTIPAGTDPSIVAIVQSIKRQDQKRDFIPGLAKQAGYAVWNKAKSFTTISNNNLARIESDSGKIAIIPFVKEYGNITNAVLFVNTKGSDTTFKLLYASEYERFGFHTNQDSISALNVFHLFAKFDYEIFRHRIFLIKDKRLAMGNHVSDSANLYAEFRMIAATECDIIDWCWVWEDEVLCAGGCSRDCFQYSHSTEECHTVWNDTGGGGSGGEGGGSNGGDGDDWENDNPCRTTPGNNNPCSGGNTNPPGWVPVVDEDLYNPYLYDSVGYTDALKDNYPCMLALLQDSLPNINFLAQLAGDNVFNDSAYIHLTFDTSTVDTQEGEAGASTVASSVIVDPNGFTHFTATIAFNGWYLRNGTKEYKISRILHECMHAIFSLRWGQYLQWLQNHTGPIDSFYIKSHFPIYWSYINHQTVGLSELQDHEIMASDYVNFFSNIGRPFYNPSASTAIRDTVLKALGYGGLRQTTGWKLLPNQGIDTCKYRNINLTASESLIGTYSVNGCPSFTANYADSLKLTPGCK
jgi:hypothetical protein